MADDAIDPERLVIPGLAALYRPFAPLSYAFMRFSTGALLLPHGVQKAFFGSIAHSAAGIAQHGLPFPVFLAYCAVFSEFVASTCLALGLFTRVAAVIVWI